MPFKSKAQMRFMYKQFPEVAKRWEREYGVPKDLPEYNNKKIRKEAVRRALSKKS